MNLIWWILGICPIVHVADVIIRLVLSVVSIGLRFVCLLTICVLVFTVTSLEVISIPVLAFILTGFFSLGKLWSLSFFFLLLQHDGHGALVDVAFQVVEVGELEQVFEKWVLFHVLHLLLLVDLLGEDEAEYFLEAAEWVNWSSFSFWGLEEVFSSWVKSLVWILSRSTSASSAGWWISELSVRTFRVLLLHMSVQGGIREISFVAVLAFEVSAHVIILTSSLSALSFSIVRVLATFGTLVILRALGVVIFVVLICHMIEFKTR